MDNRLNWIAFAIVFGAIYYAEAQHRNKQGISAIPKSDEEFSSSHPYDGSDESPNKAREEALKIGNRVREEAHERWIKLVELGLVKPETKEQSQRHYYKLRSRQESPRKRVTKKRRRLPEPVYDVEEEDEK